MGPAGELLPEEPLYTWNLARGVVIPIPIFCALTTINELNARGKINSRFMKQLFKMRGKLARNNDG